MAAKSKKRAKTVGKLTVTRTVKNPKPPAGLYDPALDAALSASKRGLGDTQADYARDYGTDGAGGRQGNDLQLGLQALGTSRDRQLQDLGFQRTDVGTQSTRENQDWQTAIANLNRQYATLATGQAQGDRHAGVTSSGLLAQQQQIRAANQAVDQAPIDTAHARAGEDTQTALSRIGVNEGRVGADYDTGAGQLGLQYQRAGEDASTALARAKREVGQFGIDTKASEIYQATGAGWTPPKKTVTLTSPGQASSDAARANAAQAAAQAAQGAAVQAGTAQPVTSKRKRRPRAIWGGQATMGAF